jgi:tRNA(Ile)-lysidine synthase TilS/MesJ
MLKQLPHAYFRKLWRAIIEFDLIAAGDKILVGLSGGKDSLFLTYALATIRDNTPCNFELAAFTLDPMFTADFATDKLAKWCGNLNVPFYTEQVNVAGIIAKNKGKDPCFTCSFFRRGAINRFALANGFNKVALAHHHDDAVETFLMSILYSGQIKTFLPKTYLDRTDLTVIRPLVYFREQELKNTAHFHGLTPIASPCPLDGRTKRQEVKELIASLGEQNPAIFDHLANAMRRQPTPSELWPAEPSQSSLRAKHVAFWASQRTKKK